MSKKLNTCEKNYSTIEKECLALVRAIEHFQMYFGSNPIIVYTDHNPLTFINKAKGINQTILRWSFFLQQFDHHSHNGMGEPSGRCSTPGTYKHIETCFYVPALPCI